MLAFAHTVNGKSNRLSIGGPFSKIDGFSYLSRLFHSEYLKSAYFLRAFVTYGVISIAVFIRVSLFARH